MSSSHITKLSNANYPKWAIGMKVILVRKDLWEVASSPATDTCPTSSDSTKAVHAWCTKITEACAKLIINVKPSQYTHIQSHNAHEAWSELCCVHLTCSFGTCIAHRHAFWCMAKHPDQPMTTWIADVHCTAFCLKKIGAPVTEEDCILVLMNSLSDSYSQLIVTLDSTPPNDLMLETIITHLLNKEACQLAATPIVAMAVTPDIALAAAMKPHTLIKHITCFACGKKGHYQCNCPQLKKELANEAW